MKKYFLPLLVLFSVTAFTQEVDFGRIIYPDSVEAPTFEERLVQLAWQNSPINRTYESEQYIAKKVVLEEQLAWTEDVKASFNLNEGNINPDVSNTNLFFPRYNFNVTIPLGTFVLTPVKTKQAKGHLAIANAELQQRKLEVRAETLRRYQHYLTQVELLNIKTEAAENLWSTFLMVEENYENGRATLQEYNLSLYTYNKAKEEKVIKENDLYQARISLEELIGVPLNSLR